MRLTNNEIIIIAAFGIAFLILLVFCIYLCRKLNTYIKQQNRVMKVINNNSIEDMLVLNFEEMRRIENNYREIKNNVDRINIKLKGALQNTGMVKYAVAPEVGGKISYSAAFTDDNENGLIITGLYYRDGMNTFVKELKNGKTSLELTPEEQQAVNLAIHNKQNKQNKM